MTIDPAIEAALSTLRHRRTEIDEAIRALERLGASNANAGTPARPARAAAPRKQAGGRGAKTDAVEEILRATPGRGLTPEQLAHALEEKGVPLRSDDPPRAARAAANRARSRNERIVLRDGRFLWLGAEAMPPDHFEADGGDSS